METKWFDEKTGIFRLDEIVAQRESFQKIMADQMVTDQEIRDQSALVVNILKKLHETLPEEHRKDVMNLLVEITVLYAATKYHDIQELWRR